MIRHHHEHIDGGGYPDGHVGEEIPIEARIIAISDAFDAVTSLRPHRASMTPEMALQEMKEGAGKQFDPAILETFLKEKLYDSPVDYSAENRASNLLHSHSNQANNATGGISSCCFANHFSACSPSHQLLIRKAV
jgi:HD-GYP domain-containing protein (c-di-GMP phosphodiesterase class II)